MPTIQENKFIKDRFTLTAFLYNRNNKNRLTLTDTQTQLFKIRNTEVLLFIFNHWSHLSYLVLSWLDAHRKFYFSSTFLPFFLLRNLEKCTSLWVHTEQNTFLKTSRSKKNSWLNRTRDSPVDEGVEIEGQNSFLNINFSSNREKYILKHYPLCKFLYL